jgi:transcriptional regulator
MYNIAPYNNVSHQAVIEFIQQNPFGIITNTSADFPVATHFPFLVEVVDDKILLSGHFMRKTNHHLSFEKNNKVLVIFNSPHAYIDANWYTNKGVGSTVNYLAVHAQGIIEFGNDEAAYTTFEKITNKHIKADSEAGYAQISDEYKQKMARAVAAFTITITHIDAIFKLNQSKTEEERKNIIQHLKQRQQPGDLYIADQMEKLLL